MIILLFLIFICNNHAQRIFPLFDTCYQYKNPLCGLGFGDWSNMTSSIIPTNYYSYFPTANGQFDNIWVHNLTQDQPEPCIIDKQCTITGNGFWYNVFYWFHPFLFKRYHRPNVLIGMDFLKFFNATIKQQGSRYLIYILGYNYTISLI
jgi:hypothetical protein